jgi:hypothetical protein
MNTHHTKTKGDLGVLKAQADLCEKGYLVCLPLSEHCPFDLVAYSDYRFTRVQVKTRSLRSGTLSVRFESSYSDSRGVHMKKVDPKSVDVYCVYCPETDECYYFRLNDFIGKHTISLRVNKTRNGQARHVRWADDYRKVP